MMPEKRHIVTEVMFEERHLRLLRILHTSDGSARLLKMSADADAVPSAVPPALTVRKKTA